MNHQVFCDYFSQFAETDGGVDQLRRLILSLAVRGKLVEQNPSDEPASQLLPRLASEKSLWRGDAVRPFADPQPHVVPATWEWARLEQIVDFEIGRTPPTKDSRYWTEADGFPWVSIRDMPKYGVVNRTRKMVSEISVDEVFKKPPTPSGTLLMSFKLSIGKVALLDMDAYHNEAIISIYPPIGELGCYLHRCLRGLNLLADTTGAVKGATLNKTKLRSLPVPIPPLAEQPRIVAKVDELMGLCDDLEARQQQQREARLALSAAHLHRLVDPRRVSLSRKWTPIRDHFELLYDSSTTVTQLRHAILQLAVTGQLVRQESKSEPASSLLERLRTQQEQLVEAKTIRRTKPLPPVKDGPAPFELPASWSWSRLGQLSKAVDYGTSHKASGDSIGVPVLRMGNIQGGYLDFEDLKYVPSSISDLPRLYLKPDDLLFNRTNSYELVGKAALFKGKADAYSFASYLIRVTLLDGVSPDFLNYALNAPYFRRTQVEPSLTQQCGQANFNGTKLRLSLVPLPPAEEQRRIVAKVRKLLALCDDLQTKLERAESESEKLMAAVFQRLVAA